MVITSSLGSHFTVAFHKDEPNYYYGGQFDTLYLKGDTWVYLSFFFSYGCFAAHFVFITAVLFCLTFSPFCFSYFITNFHTLFYFLIWFLLSSLHIHKKKLQCLFSSFSICLAVWLGSVHGQLDFFWSWTLAFKVRLGTNFNAPLLNFLIQS